MSKIRTENSIANLDIKRPSGETNVTPELLAQLKDKPKPIRMTIEISDEQHTKLKLFAARNKKTMIAVLRGFIDGLPE
jgi:hypothetical protein